MLFSFNCGDWSLIQPKSVSLVRIYVWLSEFSKSDKEGCHVFLRINVFYLTMCVKSNVYDSPQIWNDNVSWCDARLQFNIHDIVDKTSGQGLRHCTFLWILHTIGLNADTFGTTMLLIWQILTDYPGRTKMSGRVFGSRVNIYLCLIHRASSSCWGSGLQLRCECQKNIKRLALNVCLF